MKHRVIITGKAEQDVLSNHLWWGENRSVEEANRWLEGIYAAMNRLAITAERHTFATETVLRKSEIRQANFGLGRRPSHRIIYAIDGHQVVVFRVRAFKQHDIDSDDLD